MNENVTQICNDIQACLGGDWNAPITRNDLARLVVAGLLSPAPAPPPAAPPPAEATAPAVAPAQPAAPDAGDEAREAAAELVGLMWRSALSPTDYRLQKASEFLAAAEARGAERQRRACVADLDRVKANCASVASRNALDALRLRAAFAGEARTEGT